jgi:hypothetical protein
LISSYLSSHYGYNQPKITSKLTNVLKPFNVTKDLELLLDAAAHSEYGLLQWAPDLVLGVKFENIAC